MKVWRYVLAVVVLFVGLLVLTNIPNLFNSMLQTLTKISWQDWGKYLIGAVTGTAATFWAMKPKKAE